jgi:hypothetical protein
MMTGNRITIRHSILIAKPRELVWEYTQNYDNRTAWDSSVLEATVLQTTPNRIVKLKMKGNTTMAFIYKLDKRPYKTSLVAKEITNPLIVNAGGSWIYEVQNEKTLWTQTNTIVFKQTFLLKLLLPIYRLIFSWSTKIAMKKAKEKIENL